MTTTAGKRAAWIRPLLLVLLALAVVAGVALIDLYRDQNTDYCDAIAQELRRSEALGSQFESHAARTRRQYEAECR